LPASLEFQREGLADITRCTEEKNHILTTDKHGWTLMFWMQTAQNITD
jgi:hypothetical protein